LSTHFLERGDLFFKLISRYDDVLADVLKREGYKAGDTLRLILPFLAAFGVSNADMEAYSARSLRFVPDAKEALGEIRAEMPTFIISTSYEPYVKAVCACLDFPFENAYCTQVDLDRYPLSSAEEGKLKRFYQEILSLPMIEIPENVTSFGDFSSKDRETIERLDEIFWAKISDMEIGRILTDVVPVGGREKVEAIHDSLRRTGRDLSELIYVGDSITDAEALALVRQGGGLAVSFNGNRYALKSAEVACLSESARPIAAIAKAFQQGGKQEVIALCEQDLTDTNTKLTTCIDELLVEESEALRKALRGEKVGELG
jgi:energy-converting hydrogenase A subunit R